MALFGFIPDRSPAAEPVQTASEAAAETARLAALQPVHPGPRELRAQAVHRLQIGLFGLAGMLLLVSLANVIMDRAKQVERTTAGSPAVAASPSASPSTANDPLVDMGVAPELPVSGGAKPVRQAPRPAGN
jgi:phage tail tape-measure protein